VIEVEAGVSIGLGHFSIVWLPDGAIKESRDRIMAALNNACGGLKIFLNDLDPEVYYASFYPNIEK